MLMRYTDAVDRLMGKKPKGKSVIDVYLELMIMPCGSIHQHTLDLMQNESLL